MKSLFLEDMAGKTEKEILEHLKEEWKATDEQLQGMHVIVAYESVGSWGCDSSGFYLLKKGREYFEVHGSHCSCYGFEDSFSPEKTSLAYLRSDKFSFLRGGYCGTSDAVEQVQAFIKENI